VRALISLLIASLVTLVLSVSSFGRTPPPAVPSSVTFPFRGSPRPHEVRKGPRNERPAVEIGCGAPGTLRLRRFEDGSAQLLCGGRVLVRVSVPG
jgi:hypothetical protein